MNTSPKENFTKYDYHYLGKGTYAKLYKMSPSENQTGQIIDMENIDLINNKSIKEGFVIKIFYGNDFGIPHALISELCNTNGLGCKNIIEFFGILQCDEDNEDRYALIMDHYRGDMKKFKNEVSLKNRIKFLREISRDLLKALYVIKKNNILHRDIKPENILMEWDDNLSKCPHVCLIDFGLSIKNLLGNVGWDDIYTNMYTIWYRSPEIACQKIYSYGKYDDKADIWALGCTLYEYICRKPLIVGNKISSYLRIIRELVGDTNRKHKKNGTNTIDVKHEIDIRGLFQKILGEEDYKEIPQSYIALLSKMLKIDPEERISVEEALRDPIFLPYEDIEFNIFKQSYPLSNYLSTTTTIDVIYKNKMLKWLMTLSCRHRYEISTYVIAVDIFDRYSSKNINKITCDNIKLYLEVCLGLAYKYNEQMHININYDYCEVEYMDTELDVYRTVGFDIYNGDLCTVLRSLKSKKYNNKKLYKIFGDMLPDCYTSVKDTTYMQIAEKIMCVLTH